MQMRIPFWVATPALLLAAPLAMSLVSKAGADIAGDGEPRPVSKQAAVSASPGGDDRQELMGSGRGGPG